MSEICSASARYSVSRRMLGGKMRTAIFVTLLSGLALTGCVNSRTIYFENGRADLEMAYPPQSAKLLLPQEKQDIQESLSDGRFISQIRGNLEKSKVCSGVGGRLSSTQTRAPKIIVDQATVARGNHKIDMNVVITVHCNAAR